MSNDDLGGANSTDEMGVLGSIYKSSSILKKFLFLLPRGLSKCGARKGLVEA